MARHHPRRARRSIRLAGYDYGRPGVYFVTICTKHRSCVFASIRGEELTVSRAGAVVHACWAATPGHFPNVALDEFAVMPNHGHGVLVMERRGTPWRAPTEAFGRPAPGSIATIIRPFKSSVTRLVKRDEGLSESLWQRGYYEHVVRDEEGLNRLRQGIAENPLKWEEDAENPALPRAQRRP